MRSKTIKAASCLALGGTIRGNSFISCIAIMYLLLLSELLSSSTSRS